MSLLPSPEMYFTPWPPVPHHSRYNYGRMPEVWLDQRRADMHYTRISTD